MYNHTQVGRLMIAVLFLIIVLFSFEIWVSEFDKAMIGVAILIVAILLSFTSLNVIVDENNLKIKFGYGLFSKKFDLKEMASAEVVKNHWYYGWGMRFWAPKKMWIYNVSGFDAVEINMKNGRVYRIGTDDQVNLVEAINNKTKLN